ncbi:helix-turn-helix domain-containing protein [Trinickia diaoshuihuensis]|uniref:helix-turn-helix domain-containing protein n=1 Tax=Trinickia diaoshuihuensis TaxID=2292265 RepID=UPI000E2878D5|nr:AraC family transcriptional regulator [Trinickia diaoshuihuensis]
MNAVTIPNANRIRSAPFKRFSTTRWTVELLPRHAYEVAYTPQQAVVGFAFESQSGTHAFASDRIRPFMSKPNSLAYVPAGCTVFSSSDEGGEYLRVTTIDTSLSGSSSQRHFNDFIDPVAIEAAQVIRTQLLIGEPATLLIEEQIIALSERVKRVLTGRSTEPKLARSMTSARLRAIDAIIESSLGEEITIKSMADAVGLSEAFFIRAFKAATGKSPHSYLIDRRLAKARALLATSRFDLREIALAVGFSSHAHMTAAFRARLGIVPTRLRQG